MSHVGFRGIKMPFLDSDLIITYLRKIPKNTSENAQKRKRFATQTFEKLIDNLQDGEKLKITIFNMGELYVGCFRKSMQSGNSYELIQEFLEKFEVLGYTLQDTKKFGEIKANLLDAGKIIGDMDILIASIVINHNDMIDHFSSILNVKIANWMEDM